MGWLFFKEVVVVVVVVEVVVVVVVVVVFARVVIAWIVLFLRNQTVFDWPASVIIFTWWRPGAKFEMSNLLLPGKRGYRLPEARNEPYVPF